MNKNSTFLSERLYFRGIHQADTDRLVAWRSDPGIVRYFRNTIPLTREDHEQWYQKIYIPDPTRFDFIILEKVSKKAIGTVGVSHIDFTKYSCEISYMIAEYNCQRRGYAVESIAAMMKVMKKEGICNFFAEVHSENIASRRTIEKLKYVYHSERLPFIIYYKRENADAFNTN